MQRLLRSIALEVKTAHKRTSMCTSTNARRSTEIIVWDRMHVTPQVNMCKGFSGISCNERSSAHGVRSINTRTRTDARASSEKVNISVAQNAEFKASICAHERMQRLLPEKVMHDVNEQVCANKHMQRLLRRVMHEEGKHQATVDVQKKQ